LNLWEHRTLVKDFLFLKIDRKGKKAQTILITKKKSKDFNQLEVTQAYNIFN